MQESMQIMRDAICVFFQIDQRFYPLFVLSERNQIRLEPSSEILGFLCEVGCFSQSQSIQSMQRKTLFMSESCIVGS